MAVLIILVITMFFIDADKFLNTMASIEKDNNKKQLSTMKPNIERIYTEYNKIK